MTSHFEIIVDTDYELTAEDRALIARLAKTSGWSEEQLRAVRKALGERDTEYAKRVMEVVAEEPPPTPEGDQ